MASAPGVTIGPAVGGPQLALVGGVTWRETATLREVLFDLLEQPGLDRLDLDVSGVTAIDRIGVGLLIGVNHRAAAVHRPFALIDSGGAVSRELAHLGLLDNFELRRRAAVPVGVTP